MYRLIHYSLTLVFSFFLIFPSLVCANWQDELKKKIECAHYPQWMREQIQEDLAPFAQHDITIQEIEDTWKDITASGHGQFLVLCQIKNNKLSYYPPIPDSDSRALRLISGLKMLIETVRMPDVQFIVFTGESFLGDDNRAPIFTWCRHLEKGKRSVCFPDYEALTGNYHLLKEVDLGNRLYPWEYKIGTAIWRGNLTGGHGEPELSYMSLPRVKLVQVSKAFPMEINAKLTGQIGDNDLSEMRITLSPYTGNNIPISAHLQYKYQILVDGHVSAFSRAYWQLFANCLIFKQSSPWYQWFYRALRPYEHYIPYKADASDLVEKIKWAVQNDSKARQISEHANDFATNNLKHSDVMLYVYLLLSEYAKLQKL